MEVTQDEMQIKLNQMMVMMRKDSRKIFNQDI